MGVIGYYKILNTLRLRNPVLNCTGVFILSKHRKKLFKTIFFQHSNNCPFEGGGTKLIELKLRNRLQQTWITAWQLKKNRRVKGHARSPHQLLLQVDGPDDYIVAHGQDEEEQEAQLPIAHLPHSPVVEHWLPPVW